MDAAALVGPLATVLTTLGGLGLVQAWAARNKDRLTNDASIRGQLLERIAKLEKDGADRERDLEARIDRMAAEYRAEIADIRRELGEYVAKYIKLMAEHERMARDYEEVKLRLARLMGRMDANRDTPEHRDQTAENNRILTNLEQPPEEAT